MMRNAGFPSRLPYGAESLLLEDEPRRLQFTHFKRGQFPPGIAILIKRRKILGLLRSARRRLPLHPIALHRQRLRDLFTGTCGSRHSKLGNNQHARHWKHRSQAQLKSMYSEVPPQIMLSVPFSLPASSECWVLSFRIQFYLDTQHFNNNTKGEPRMTRSSPLLSPILFRSRLLHRRRNRLRLRFLFRSLGAHSLGSQRSDS